jgi:hypothetical protein
VRRGFSFVSQIPFGYIAKAFSTEKPENYYHNAKAFEIIEQLVEDFKTQEEELKAKKENSPCIFPMRGTAIFVMRKSRQKKRRSSV